MDSGKRKRLGSDWDLANEASWGFIDCMAVLLYEIGMFSASFLFESNFLACISFIGCLALDSTEFCLFREPCFGAIGS